MCHPHSRQIWAPKKQSNLKFNPLTRHVRTLPQLRCPGRAFSILPKFTLPRATSARGGSTKKKTNGRNAKRVTRKLAAAPRGWVQEIPQAGEGRKAFPKSAAAPRVGHFVKQHTFPCASSPEGMDRDNKDDDDELRMPHWGHPQFVVVPV